MEIQSYIQKKVALIDAKLLELLPETGHSYETLFQAARYSLLSPGKRLRPLLLLATVEMLSGDEASALAPACAIEMIHTYSLIHDDLPCMDNDDFRRGQPTLHRVFPEWQALLTGDFLLTYAFEVLSNPSKLTSALQVKLIALLAQASGGDGMIAGQVLDLLATGKKIELQELQLMHTLKTGALLTASVEAGGMIAGADERTLKSLKNFGQKVGLAFQIVDDVLDVTSSKKKHGKELSSDQINQKMTYVTLLGLDGCKQVADELYAAALSHLEEISCDTFLLRELASLLVHR